MHHVAIEILLLLLIGSVVGIVARRWKVPYTLMLVIVGIGLGFVHFEQFDAFQLNADVLFTFLLPALLFEAAYHLQFKDFYKNKLPILTLAIPGVLIAVAVTTVLVKGLIGDTGLRPEFGWAHAALFAAVIAATDPISVLALFKELGVPKRLYLMVEGESLVNDGVAVVVFIIVAAVFAVDVGHGGGHHAVHGLGEIALFGFKTFIWMAGMGVLIGAIAGTVATSLMRQFDDHLVEITLTTVVAYGSFLLAEELHASGVLATVTAGIVLGSFGTRFGMSTTTRLAVEDFWEYMAFAANTFVFLLVGLQLEVTALAQDVVPILLGFVAMLIGRAVAVYGLIPVTRLDVKPVSLQYGHVLVWGGLKGSLSMVLILGVSQDFAGSELLVRLVFGVVSASLFMQGLTIKPLLRRLSLSGDASEEDIAVDVQRAQVIANIQALQRLEMMLKEGLVDDESGMRARSWYQQSLQHAQNRVGQLLAQEKLNALARDRSLATQLIDVEREAIRHASRRGEVSRVASHRALAQLDVRLESLENGPAVLSESHSVFAKKTEGESS